MKNKIILLMCLFLSILSFGQDPSHRLLDEVKVTPPKFTGIERVRPVEPIAKFESIEDYMVQMVEYPESAMRLYRQGTEVVQFVVTSNGELQDFKVINSISPEIDKEVIDALKTTTGMWVPGSNNGNPVSMEKEVSIVFKIDTSEDMGITLTNDFMKLGQSYFTKGSICLLEKNNPKRALKYFDRGIVLLPNSCSLLMERGLARYALGDQTGACQDWTRIKSLGGFEGDVYLEKYCEMIGYNELKQILLLDE